MSRNGSGTYSLPVNSWNPAVNGVPATAADWQALINDVASAITQSVSRDGQTTLTGNLPMGSNKLTGLASGTAAGDSLRWEQLFSQGQPQDLASAATVDIGAQLTTVLNITGTTTITSFGTNYNGPRFLRFAGALTLTHGAALVLPGAANITTAAGDAAIVVPLGSPASGWRVVAYQRASGEPIALADGSITLAKLASSAYGTSGANKLLQLDGTGKLPAVDGSQLTGISTIQAGAVSYFALTSAPTGWLKANGAAISRTTYAALFLAIGTTYGVGDGATTFNLPDLRGEFVRGWDDGRGVDAGRGIGTFQNGTQLTNGIRGTSNTTRIFPTLNDAEEVATNAVSVGNNTAAEPANGLGNTFRTRPRNVALLACIKY